MNLLHHLHLLLRRLPVFWVRRPAIQALHLSLSCASSGFKPSKAQSSLTVDSHVIFGRPRGRVPSISHCFHVFFTHSVLSLRITWPSHLSLLFLKDSVISSSPVNFRRSSVEFLLHNLLPHNFLVILLSAVFSRLSFSVVIGQVSLPYKRQLLTHALYTLPFIFREGALEVRKGASSLNFFHPH